LNDIRLKDFFIFEDGNIKVRDETALSRLQHAATYVGLQPSEQTELLKAEAEFRQGQGPEKFIRGKYMLWFLVEFALEIHRSVPSLLVRFTTSPKVRITIGSANAMVILAPRVRCPSSLQRFLDRTYVEYIRESTRSQSTIRSLPVGDTA